MKLPLLRMGIFAALPSLILLVAMEFYARKNFQVLLPTSAQAPGPITESGCIRPDPLMGFVPAPGQCGNDNRGVMLRRGGDGPPGARRVILLGDSVTHGLGSATLLETRLSSGWGGVPTVVRNMGVPGYDSCQEWQHLERTGWSLNPDLVILMFCVNDDNLQTILAPMDGGRVMLTVGREHFVFPRLLLHSRLALWLATVAVDTQISEYEAPRNISRDCVAAMAKSAREHNVPFMVALLPALESARPEELMDPGLTWREITQRRRPGGAPPVLEWEALARTNLRSLGVPFLDLRPVLETSGPLEDLRRGPHDNIHVGTRGSHLILEATADFVLHTEIISTR